MKYKMCSMQASIQCGNFNCRKIKLKKCSGCNKEGYCSAECQKDDWKIHKLLCACMKNDDELLPFHEVEVVINSLKGHVEKRKRSDDSVRIAKYCLAFAEYQFGNRIIGKPYRERDGIQVDNWNIEIITLDTLCYSVCHAYTLLADNMEKSDTNKEIMKNVIFYQEKSLSIFEPWLKQIDEDESERVDILNEIRIDRIFVNLSNIHVQLGECHQNLDSFETARNCFDKALIYANRIMEGETKTLKIYEAIFQEGRNLYYQAKYIEAKSVYEECYNFIVEAYYPDHPKVLRAANMLINVLFQLNEWHDAGRYARISYECLTRPVDTESMDVGLAAEALAVVTHKLIVRNGTNKNGSDLVEAEMLARKALRIKERIHNPTNPNHRQLGSTLSILADILSLKDDRDRDDGEIKDLLGRRLAILIRGEGADSDSVAEANNELCTFHYDYSNNLPNGDVKRGHLQQALIHMKEALRIRSIIYGLTNPKTIENQTFISHLEFLNLVNKENRDDDEKKLMFQEYLSLDLKEGGIDIDNMVVLEANDQLATIYLNSSNKMTGDAKREELRIALSHAKEAVRISTKLHGTNNPQTIQYQTVLSQLRFLYLAS